MHGLINRAIQTFTRDTYGAEVWADVVLQGELETPEFEAMLVYDDRQTLDAIAALADRLGRGRRDLLEDIGTYLVSHPNCEGLRRLLRFGGASYSDFLDSLDELPGRARLAVPDLHLPGIEVRQHAGGRYSLTVYGDLPGWGDLLAGVLRAMADDYGALVILGQAGGQGGTEAIDITVVESAFAEGRSFDLAANG